DKNPDRLHADDRFSAGVPAGHPEGYLDAFRNVIDESWRAMRSERVINPSFGDGARGLALVEAAVKSAKAHSPAGTRTTPNACGLRRTGNGRSARAEAHELPASGRVSLPGERAARRALGCEG